MSTNTEMATNTQNNSSPTHVLCLISAMVAFFKPLLLEKENLMQMCKSPVRIGSRRTPTIHTHLQTAVMPLQRS